MHALGTWTPGKRKKKGDLGCGHESLLKHPGKQEIRSDQKLNNLRTH